MKSTSYLVFDLVLVLAKFCEKSHLGRDKTPRTRQFGADNSAWHRFGVRQLAFRRFALRAVLGLELDLAGLHLAIGFFGTSAQRSLSWPTLAKRGLGFGFGLGLA